MNDRPIMNQQVTQAPMSLPQGQQGSGGMGQSMDPAKLMQLAKLMGWQPGQAPSPSPGTAPLPANTPMIGGL